MVWKSNLEHTTGLQQNCYARMAGSCDMTMAHLIYPARDIACFSGWSNMNMYLCVYIYTRYRFGYLPVQGLLTVVFRSNCSLK
jgi:hypothetical protein